MRNRVALKFGLTFHRPADLTGGHFTFLLQSMRYDHDALPRKEIQNSIVDAMIGRTQLVDPVPKEIRRRTPKFVAFGFQLRDVGQALDLDLGRLFLQPVSNRNRFTFFEEDNLRLRP